MGNSLIFIETSRFEFFPSFCLFPVGTCSGAILMFYVPSEGTEVKLQETLEYHKVGITDVAGTEDKMVSADEDGNITVWHCKEQTRQILAIRGAG